MIGNIYYDVKMNYLPIDWESEHIQIFNDDNKFTIELVKIVLCKEDLRF